MENTKKYHHKRWFALLDNGTIWIAGDHGDIESVDEELRDHGLKAIWIWDESMASEAAEKILLDMYQNVPDFECMFK